MRVRELQFKLICMALEDNFRIFDSLTQKQHEALALASSHLTSKQIAVVLGVAPVTIDKRIETVRARLDHISRTELLHRYTQWTGVRDADGTYGQTINDPIILGAPVENLTTMPSQPPDHRLTFEDSVTFDARASWDRNPAWLRSELKPADLGVRGKLAFMLGGALVVMMIAVLCLAFVDALMSIM